MRCGSGPAAFRGNGHKVVVVADAEAAELSVAARLHRAHETGLARHWPGTGPASPCNRRSTCDAPGKATACITAHSATTGNAMQRARGAACVDHTHPSLRT